MKDKTYLIIKYPQFYGEPHFFKKKWKAILFFIIEWISYLGTVRVIFINNNKRYIIPGLFWNERIW